MESPKRRYATITHAIIPKVKLENLVTTKYEINVAGIPPKILTIIKVFVWFGLKKEKLPVSPRIPRRRVSAKDLSIGAFS